MAMVLCISGMGVLLIFRKPKERLVKPEVKILNLIALEKGVRESITEVLGQNLSRENMRESEMEKCQKTRRVLRKALRTCGHGDAGAKDYVKAYMKSLLQRKFCVNEDTIDRIFPFQTASLLTSRDKFDILLYIYRVKKGYGRNALEHLLCDNQLDRLQVDAIGRQGYQVTKNDLDSLYFDQICPLSFGDKLEILTQRIFSMNKGNGAIDDIIYQKIDGVSGGVSGVTAESYESIWIMLRGKSIHLEFLSFETEQELRRICKNIYKYDAPGQLSQATGYLVNNLKSGARVSDMRPPFSNTWTFWIRMFDSVEKKTIEELFPQENVHILKDILYFIIRGEQTCVITGQQGCGKTTCLEALVDFINPIYNIRTIELTFELQLEKVYPQRNIAAMRETKTVSTEDAMEFVKKTDADVVIFGEIAKEVEGEKVVKLAQSGSRFSMSTHHGVTTRATIDWFRNALLHKSGFHNETIAERQVADAIRFDIHLAKTSEGQRVIERITEIVRTKPSDKETYCIQDILLYEGGSYRFCHSFSSSVQREIQKRLSLEERENFNHFCGGEI